jgi:hypothetical protein
MLINCTPHPITVRTPHGDQTFAPSGIIPRVSTTETPAEEIDGITTVTSSVGEVAGLPEAQAFCPSCKCPVHFGSGPDCECGGTIEDVFLIVSRMVFDATDRIDVVCPDTGSTCIRDEKGRIQAVTRLIHK